MTPELKLVMMTGMILVIMNLSLLIYLLKSTKHEEVIDDIAPDSGDFPIRKSRDFRGIPVHFLGQNKQGHWIDHISSEEDSLRIIRTHFGDIDREPKD